MGSMYRLKAYFGMVPAEELAEYADEPYTPPARRTVRDYAAEHDPEPRDRETVSRWDDRYVADDDRYDADTAANTAKIVSVITSCMILSCPPLSPCA